MEVTLTLVHSTDCPRFHADYVQVMLTGFLAMTSASVLAKHLRQVPCIALVTYMVHV